MMLNLGFALLLLSCSKNSGEQPAPTPPTLSIEGIAVAEGNSEAPVYIRLRLSAAADNIVTAYISTEDGSANADTDYRPVSQTPVVFPSGTTIQEFKIQILGDADFEQDEAFTVRIKSADGAQLGTATATVTLLNDDQAPVNIIIPPTGYSTPKTYSGMNLIWEEEFDASALNTNNWVYELGTGNSGWGNNESQFYRQENTSIYQGNLVIEARKENYNGAAYTSSRIITRGKFDFKYGRVDIRAALPSGQGIWPALWMLGSNISSIGWPSCGEIDIMEIVGHEPNTLHGTAHWSALNGQHAYIGGQKIAASGSLQNEFHVYSIIWNDQEIRWLLDDQQYYSLDITLADRSEFREKFFFIINLAVGGNWPGYPDATTVFPQHLIVDYIRVFQDM
ncbi:MAG: family 16 glycosylhydrolase [Saprospiraceae bacterium]